ncbi:MAG TPA: hypothetical protein VF265_07120 [Nevskiaceae bacterium]
MKRTVLNLVMVVVIAILAIGIYFASRPKPHVKKAALTSLNSAQVDRITVSQPDHPELVMTRTKGRWNLVKPIQAQASSVNVMSILAIATSVCQEQIKPREVKLANLGLQPPEYTVQFDDTKVAIGMMEPLKFRRYAMVGDRICIIANPSAPGLGSENYAGLVSTSLVPDGEELVKIQIPGYTAARTGKKGEWQLSPSAPGLEKNAAATLAEAWQTGRSTWNTQAPAAASPDEAGDKVILSFKNGKQERFTIASRKPRLKLVRSDIGIEYNLSAAEAASLLSPAREPPPKPASSATAAAKAPAKP